MKSLTKDVAPKPLKALKFNWGLLLRNEEQTDDLSN